MRFGSKNKSSGFCRDSWAPCACGERRRLKPAGPSQPKEPGGTLAPSAPSDSAWPGRPSPPGGPAGCRGLDCHLVAAAAATRAAARLPTHPTHGLFAEPVEPYLACRKRQLQAGRALAGKSVPWPTSHPAQPQRTPALFGVQVQRSSLSLWPKEHRWRKQEEGSYAESLVRCGYGGGAPDSHQLHGPQAQAI